MHLCLGVTIGYLKCGISLLVSLFCSESRVSIIFLGGRHVTVNLREFHLWYHKELFFACPLIKIFKSNNNGGKAWHIEDYWNTHAGNKNIGIVLDMLGHISARFWEDLIFSVVRLDVFVKSLISHSSHLLQWM